MSLAQLEQLYLIAHKSRGEADFDVAVRTEIAGEEAYVVCSSGHRAYPYWTFPLADLIDLCGPVPPMPEDAIEHWEATRAPKDPSLKADDVLRAIGLAKPKPDLSNLRRI